MAIFIVLLKGLKLLFKKENGIVSFLKLILQNLLAWAFVKFFIIYITILGDNYINFLNEKQDIIDLMQITIILGVLCYLHETYASENKIDKSIVAGIVASVLVDIKVFLVF